MTWFYFALGAPFLWALVNRIDHFLVSKYASSADTGIGSLALFSSLFGFIVAFCIAIGLGGAISLPVFDAVLLILSGVLGGVSVVLYLKALFSEEPSRVVPLFQLIPVFSYVLARIFLGEVLTAGQLVGGLVIISGSVLISLDFSSFKLNTKVLGLMTLSSLFFAVQSVLFKFLTYEHDFWLASFWTDFGLGIFGVLLFVLFRGFREDFLKTIKNSGHQILALNFTNESLTIIGNLLTGYAIVIGSVSQVSLIASYQPVFVFLFGVLGVWLFPTIFEEDLSKKALIQKIVSLCIIVLGSIIFYK